MKSSSVPVGSSAPDFAYTDAQGGLSRLSAHRGRGVLLVFFRGYWCQSCRRQLAQLEAAAGTIQSLRADLLAVSSDDSALAWPDRGTIPIVVDATLRIIDQYGVRDHDDPDRRAIARPSVFILDSGGIVRFCHVGAHRQDRPAIGAILLAIETIAGVASA